MRTMGDNTMTGTGKIERRCQFLNLDRWWFFVLKLNGPMAVNEILSVDLSTDSRDCEFLVQKAERLVETRRGEELVYTEDLIAGLLVVLNDDGQVLRSIKTTFLLIEGETAHAQDFDLEDDEIEFTEEMKLEVFQACLEDRAWLLEASKTN